MFAALVGADDAAKRALEALEAGDFRFGVVGAEGSGKSAVLGRVAECLAAKGQAVHQLALTRGDDAAFVAVVALAGQLDPKGTGLLQKVRDPRVTFGDKLNDLVGDLENRKGTLLVDDPPIRNFDLTATIFDDRLAELSDRLLQLREVRVVVASWQHRLSASVTIRPKYDNASVLDVLETGTFRKAAQALRGTPSVERYSPVELRLVAAASDLLENSSAFAHRRWDPSVLLETVLEGETELRRLVGRLALLRVPFDDDLLDELGAGLLSDRPSALLREILLLDTPGGHVLHGLIGRRARGDEWLPPQDRFEVHRRLAKWHQQRFEARKNLDDLPAAFANEVETVHHLTEAGDHQAIVDTSIYFSEQYDALGKALSIARRYSDAVQAYERAIGFDAPNRFDAYAHHYLAYNLDVLGEKQKRVRDEYALACEAQPTHPWYWGRRICFLITTGHLDDAMDLWSEAAINFQLDRGEERIATELHRNVAHLLTYRGQIDAARTVLRDVPRTAHSQDWFVSLDGWLSELEAAERDELVFPPHLEPTERWSEPHLLRNPTDKTKVVSWQPGRISSSDEDGIRVRVASRDSLGKITFAYRDISHGEVAHRSTYPMHGLQLPAGTFVEILAMVGEDGKPIEQLLSWPRQVRRLAGLPPIFPPTDRYLRRALARP